MTTSDGVTLHHPAISIGDIHPRLDIDTISILSSQSDSIQHLSYNESDDEGKGLVGSNTSRLHERINQVYQPSALKKDWIMYLTKPTNGNHNKDHQSSSDNESSSSSISDDDESEQSYMEDPWTINTVQREYYTKQFQNLQTDTTKVINGHKAKEFFERSNLPTSELSQIWNLSDVNHDGALSLAEFSTAMHLVVLRLNGFPLPEELPPQLQPYTPLIDLSDAATAATTDNWANFHPTTDSPKQFTYAQPIADNHRIVAPVAVRLSPPPPPLPPVQTTTKPPPPPPRAPGRRTSMDASQQPVLPPRTSINETPQRSANNNNNNSSTNTTPYLYNRTRPSITSTPQQSDPNVLLGQIRDLLQPDHLQELSSIISSTATNEQFDTALNQIKSRNSILKGQLKHWEDRLTDLIDKRISLELQLKLQQHQ